MRFAVLLAALLLAIPAPAQMWPTPGPGRADYGVGGGGGTIALSGCEFTQQGNAGLSITGTTSTLGIATGDLLYMTFCADTNVAAPVIVDPTGGSGSAWTAIAALDAIDVYPDFKAWYKEAATEGTDPSYTVTWATLERAQLMICKITGHNSASPQTDTIATNQGATTAATASQITVSAGALAVFSTCFDGTANEDITCATGLGANCQSLVDASTGGIITSVGWEVQSGTAGPHDFPLSPSSSDQWNALSVSFNDAP